jgi:signal transduction histidine kinase
LAVLPVGSVASSNDVVKPHLRGDSVLPGLLRRQGLADSISCIRDNVPGRVAQLSVLRSAAEGPCDDAEDAALTVLRMRLCGSSVHAQRLNAAFRRLEANAEHAQEGEAEARRDLAAALTTSRSKTQLLAALGHDLRQPLTVIVATLDMVGPDLPPGRLPALERAKRATARLERALGSLMEATQLEYGGIKPQVHAFCIDALLNEVCDQHAPDAQGKGLRFRCMPCRGDVVSDPAILGTILHNLIENAIKYTRTGRILVGCCRRGENLSVQVWDTGIGIPQEMLGAIFDEYRQLSPTRGSGVGLGLFIVKRSADLLDHSVAISSTVGKGSCFSVEVPLQLVPHRAGTKDAPPWEPLAASGKRPIRSRFSRSKSRVR